MWRADADGANPKKLVDKVVGSECSPDGTWVLYTSQGSLYRIPVEGGTPVEVMPAKPLGAIGTISADGKWIAYRYSDAERYPHQMMAVAPSAGGKPTQVFRLPGNSMGLKWAPDGKGVQFLWTTKGATNVWEQKLAGGEPAQVTNFTSGKIFDFSWTRDGKTLLLTKGNVTKDVVMISFKEK